MIFLSHKIRYFPRTVVKFAKETVNPGFGGHDGASRALAGGDRRRLAVTGAGRRWPGGDRRQPAVTGR